MGHSVKVIPYGKHFAIPQSSVSFSSELCVWLYQHGIGLGGSGTGGIG